MNVNEFGKRRVSWDSVKGGKQAGKWVASNAHNTKVGLGPSKQNAQALLGNEKPILGLGLSSPLNFEVLRVPLVDKGLWSLLTRMGSLFRVQVGMFSLP